MFTYLGPNFEVSISFGRHDHAYDGGESRVVPVFIQSPSRESQGRMDLQSRASHMLKLGTIRRSTVSFSPRRFSLGTGGLVSPSVGMSVW
jgi:hypothetical protein